MNPSTSFYTFSRRITLAAITTFLLIGMGISVASASIQENGDAPIHIASSKGCVKEVKRLIRKNRTSIDARNLHGVTPLHYAANNGRYKVVKLLTSAQANVHATDNATFTALHHAAFGGHVDIAEFLIDKKIAVDALLQSGGTPLFIAVERRHLEMVEFLIARGANVNVIDKDGNTPLHNAVSFGRVGMVIFLLQLRGDNKVKINVANHKGQTPLHVAVRWDITGIVDQRTTAQFIAALLIETGAELDVLDNVGVTPLHRAAAANLLDAAKHLIKHNAHLRGMDNHPEETPIRAARNYNSSDVVNLLESYSRAETTCEKQ